VLEGALVVVPTDTVYGVGCDPSHVDALQRIYEAKGRPSNKAVPLLLADVSDLAKVCGDLGRSAQLLGTSFWPGPLTLVVPRSDNLPPQLGQGASIAVRVPARDDLRSFIATCGGALAVTSANRSGQPDARDVESAVAYLGSWVTLYLDGGPSPSALPSTVVDCTSEPPRVLRQGVLGKSQLELVVGKVAI
jgi:L-threonylcarbamoyladenylate synthase